MQLDRRRALKLHALLVVTILVSGSVVYGALEHLPFIDSLFTVVMIMTLVGSNRDPQTALGQDLPHAPRADVGGGLPLARRPGLRARAGREHLQEWRMKQTVEADDHVILCGSTQTSAALRHGFREGTSSCSPTTRRRASAPSDEGFPVYHRRFHDEEGARAGRDPARRGAHRGLGRRRRERLHVPHGEAPEPEDPRRRARRARGKSREARGGRRRRDRLARRCSPPTRSSPGSTRSRARLPSRSRGCAARGTTSVRGAERRAAQIRVRFRTS